MALALGLFGYHGSDMDGSCAHTQYRMACGPFLLHSVHGKATNQRQQKQSGTEQKLNVRAFQGFQCYKKEMRYTQSHNAGDCGLLTNFQPRSRVRLESKMPLSSLTDLAAITPGTKR